jgi:hypothetical protein
MTTEIILLEAVAGFPARLVKVETTLSPEGIIIERITPQ